jgi:hypothetical protein
MEINQTTQFIINDLKIITKKGEIDIRGIYEEINIFDSILNPCMSGTILINDANGLSNDFLFDGTEMLMMKISKQSEELTIEKIFRIYKQSSRKNTNQNSETYVLHFISEEFVLSLQQKVSRFYETTYSEAAVKIMIDYLKVPVEKMIGIFDKSLGVKKIVVPNLNPMSAIIWMSKRAIDENSVPGFLFYENVLGYNFASLSTILNLQPSVRINFNPKNLSKTLTSPFDEFVGARHFEVIQQYDVLKNINNGVYSGKFVGFDPLTRTIMERPVSFDDHFNLMKKPNPSPTIGSINSVLGSITEQYNSKQVFHTFGYLRQSSEYIKENDPTSIQKEFDTENYMLQRKAIFTNLLNQRVKLVVPGNFSISSGFNVHLNVPNYGIKVKGEDNLDKTTYGNYLVVSTRHIIGYQKHETIFEAITDSSNRSSMNEMYQSTLQQQTRETNYA